MTRAELECELQDIRFDFVLLVTVICSVANPSALFNEARRVLKPGGRIIICFINRNSDLGRLYESRKATSPFYREARFYSTTQVAEWTQAASFDGLEFCQTRFDSPHERFRTAQVREGHGEGAFVVVSAEKTYSPK